MSMKTFQLHRKRDVSGISGTGIVAEGVQFTDNTCVIRWFSKFPSTNIYASMTDLLNIHGHDGMTDVVFVTELSKDTIPEQT